MNRRHNKSFERDASIASLSCSFLKIMLDAMRSARLNSGVRLRALINLYN